MKTETKYLLTVSGICLFVISAFLAAGSRESSLRSRLKNRTPFVFERDGREFLINPAGGILEITKPTWTEPMTLEDKPKEP
jgi:hypothetical protein